MRFLIIFIFLISNGLANEVPNIKNLVVNKELKTYENITFLDSNKKMIKLTDFIGNLVLLNFWATWCAPCKEEMPSLNNIKNISELKKINIIPINIGEEEYDKSKNFFDELGIENLEIFSGPSGDLAKKFKLRGVPTTIIIDKEGYEISRIIGSIDFLDKQFLDWLKSIVNS